MKYLAKARNYHTKRDETTGRFIQGEKFSRLREETRLFIQKICDSPKSNKRIKKRLKKRSNNESAEQNSPSQDSMNDTSVSDYSQYDINEVVTQDTLPERRISTRLSIKKERTNENSEVKLLDEKLAIKNQPIGELDLTGLDIQEREEKLKSVINTMVSILQHKVRVLEYEKNSLQKKLTKLKKSNEEEIPQNMNEIEILKNDLLQKNNDIELIKEELLQKNNENEKLKTHNTELKEEIITLKKEVYKDYFIQI